LTEKDERAIGVAFLADFFLFSGKGIIGLIVGSIALIADAIHSLTHFIVSSITYIGQQYVFQSAGISFTAVDRRSLKELNKEHR